MKVLWDLILIVLAFALSVVLVKLPEILFKPEKRTTYSLKEFRYEEPYLFWLIPVTMLSSVVVSIGTPFFVAHLLGDFLSKEGNYSMFYLIPPFTCGFVLPAGIIETLWKMSFVGRINSIRIVTFENGVIRRRGLLRIVLFAGCLSFIIATWYFRK